MGVKEVLERGLKLQKAVKEQRLDTSSKPSDMKIPDIPLDTDVGGVGLTLGGLMKKEKLSYHDAYIVYIAYQDSLNAPPPGPTPKAKKALKADKEKDDNKGSLKRKASDDAASPLCRKNAKEDLEKPTPAKKSSPDKPGKNKKPDEAGEAAPSTRVMGKSAQAKAKQETRSSKTWSDKKAKSGSVVSNKSWSKKAKVKDEPEDIARDEDQENKAAEEEMENYQDSFWQFADTQPDDLPEYPDFDEELAIFNEERRLRKLKEAEAAELQDEELDGEELGPETEQLLFGDMEIDPVTKEVSFGKAGADAKVVATSAKAPIENREITEITPKKKLKISPRKNVEITPNKNPEISPNKNPEITPNKNLEITPNKNLEITPDKNLKITLDDREGKPASEVLPGCVSKPNPGN